MLNDSEVDNQDIKVEIYGKEMNNGFIAIIPSILKKVLEENGFDKNEVLNAWKRNNYISCDKGKNTKNVRINGTQNRCIVLDMQKNIEYINGDLDNYEIPF